MDTEFSQPCEHQRAHSASTLVSTDDDNSFYNFIIILSPSTERPANSGATEVAMSPQRNAATPSPPIVRNLSKLG